MLLLALGLVSTVGAPHARSAPISTPAQTLSIPLTQTNWQPGTPTSLTNPLQFAKFDPALGQLLSVNLSLQSTFTHDISLRFVAPSTLSMQTQGSQLTLHDPNGKTLLSAIPTVVNQTTTLTNGPFPQTVTTPQILQNVAAGPISLTDPASLAMFTASRPGELIGLPAIASSSSAFDSSTGNGSGSILTSAGVEVVLTYTYVPEPSTLLILGLAFAGAGRSLSRRRARA